jgi:parvulin-like peptidyl-prolyl isomerase
LVHARHILLATKPGDDEAQKEKKRLLAESIRTQLVAGAVFADMAKKYSDCPSREQGGDLGRFGRRKMVKPFSDTAFRLPTNTISDVVETQFGYHIVQVTERSSMGRDELTEMMRRQRMLERLAKSAKIRINLPQSQRSRSSVRPTPPSLSVSQSKVADRPVDATGNTSAPPPNAPATETKR